MDIEIKNFLKCEFTLVPGNTIEMTYLINKMPEIVELVSVTQEAFMKQINNINSQVTEIYRNLDSQKLKKLQDDELRSSMSSVN